jgi:hypothetical protein
MAYPRSSKSWILAALLAAGAGYAVLQARDGALRPGASAAVTEARPVAPGVTRVVLDGPFALTLRQGTTPQLAVRAERRLLANIGTTAEGAQLSIAPRGMLLHPRQPITVTLTLPLLSAVHAGGGGSAQVEGFSGERIELTLDGSGSLRFAGSFRNVQLAVRGNGELAYAGGAADSITLDASGSGSATLTGTAHTLRALLRGSGALDASGLRAADVVLEQQGSGNSRVNASRRVQVDLRGSGAVDVAGRPPERSVTQAGSGSVRFAD